MFELCQAEEVDKLLSDNFIFDDKFQRIGKLEIKFSSLIKYKYRISCCKIHIKYLTLYYKEI